MDKLKRKAELIQYFLEECEEHMRAFNEPCPMRILSAKYGKSLNYVGGFHAIVKELALDGSVTILRKKTGGREVISNRKVLTVQVHQQAG